MGNDKPKCDHCDLKSDVKCKDCGQVCCIFCAMHGVHEMESHAGEKLPPKAGAQ